MSGRAGRRTASSGASPSRGPDSKPVVRISRPLHWRLVSAPAWFPFRRRTPTSPPAPRRMPFSGAAPLVVGRGWGAWIPPRSQGRQGQVNGFVDRDLRSQPLGFFAHARRRLRSDASLGNPSATCVRVSTCCFHKSRDGGRRRQGAGPQSGCRCERVAISGASCHGAGSRAVLRSSYQCAAWEVRQVR